MTAFALRPEDFYHTGIIVPDLEAAMARLSALAGYRWITPVSYTLPFRTVSGNAAQPIGFTPLSATHTPTPAAMPASRATNDPMKGRCAQPRRASRP